MGTWGTGPFDSDLAADFVDALEGLTHHQAIHLLERAFQRVTDSGERVDGGDGAEAVAASALVASTLPDSPIVIAPDDGPREPLPELPAFLRASARLALDRVLQDGSEMAIGWVDSADADQWSGTPSPEGSATVRRVVVRIAVAVERLVLVRHEQRVDAEELARGGVVLAGADLGEAGGAVGALAGEALVVRPSLVSHEVGTDRCDVSALRQ
ncbi:DUF4259 domain-containing protein [Streptomyces althioticus]|jgi:hypothetical protein|uniref:DUF4259 domain-containing protein n=1 Tax=Streptomyces griseorubens TaxID=66897 RepID=A0ABR4TAG6_9ACTN|nr:hypothetical protein DJ64_00430 [Streptomyces griseorubens]GGQ39442.1 hypothetical protein GCM10010250_06600 [Streptomyces althioticus]